jgi:peptidyl-prolyl cis-trans isomerase B (cyclophilin B)
MKRLTRLFSFPILLAVLLMATLPILAAAPKKPAVAPKKAAAAPIVRMQTTKGTILIKLFPKDAPISVANFEKLVSKGFYNGLKFHRVADLAGPGQGHIVQGGSPTSKTLPIDDPTIGNSGPGYTIKGEFPANGVQNPLTHITGAVAMARAQDPDSGGSQFYICTNPAHFLDGQYAVFGQVIQGLDVAKKLQVGDTMTKVTLVK